MLKTEHDYLEFVKDLHKDQVDKNGEPYFYHLYRVAKYTQVLFSPYDKGEANAENLFRVGLLHDSIEDQGMTATKLLHLGVPDAVVIGVSWMSRPEDFPGTYLEWIELLSSRAPLLALKTKLADNIDNSDPTRVCPQTLKEKYLKASQIMIKGLQTRFGIVPNLSFPSLYSRGLSDNKIRQTI